MAKLSDNYINEILKDVKLQGLSEKEQAEALLILQERFDSVVLQTLVALTNGEQKQRLTTALEKNDKVEEVISDISSEIPEFSDALDQALLAEYESIREVMQSQSK